MSGKFALIFGNTQYVDASLAQLTAPGKDAADLGRVLKDPGLCNFDEVRVSINPPSSAAIEAIDEFFDGRKPDDLLVLYFSGHGIRDELGSLYLAFSNTLRTRLRSTALKAEYIREAMDESRSRRQVLILDCCNSGAFPPGTKAELGGAMGMTAALQGYGRYVLTASDATQFAWEGDRVIGETQNSLFTHFLVRGLEGEADQDADGTISVDDLYDYAFEQISRATPRQTPTKSATKQEGEIILRRITRIKDIRPVALPDELMEAIVDERPFVRLGAVEQLGRLLSGKNLGLARSARQALEKMCAEDDSLRVRKAASEALAPILEAERQERQKAEQARQAQEALEQQRLAEIQAQQQQAARQKVEADRRAQQQAEKERLAQGKAEAKRQAEQAARKKAQEAQPGLLPQWISALWIALGCSILAVLPDFIQPSHAFSRVFGGLAVAGILYLQRVVKQWQSLLWIAFGWAVAWGLASKIIEDNRWWLISSALPVNRAALIALAGAIAGLAIVLALHGEKIVFRRDTMVWISLAWAMAGIVDALIFYVIVLSETNAGRSRFPTYAIPDSISAAAGAALGSLLMIWLIQVENSRLEGKEGSRPSPS